MDQYITPEKKRAQPPSHPAYPQKPHRTVYRDVCRPLLDIFFAGGNATCFAYGQTGSGKTHTMIGKGDEKGVYLLAVEDVFRDKSRAGRTVSVAFYEIYGRKVFDLLNGRNRCMVREDGDKNINICGLTEQPAGSIDEVLRMIDEGSAVRSQGVTGANADSSRSHAVLRIELFDPNRGRKQGQLSFIDLAGNERGSDTRNCDRQTRMEGAEINKSLLALKECIRALGMGKSHIPFRGSILTEVLRTSFTGKSRTAMIANISPASTNCEHTLNTLRYTDRVKELRPAEKKGQPMGPGAARGKQPQAGRRAPAAAAPEAGAAYNPNNYNARDGGRGGAAGGGGGGGGGFPARQQKMSDDVMQLVRRLKQQLPQADVESDNEDDDDEEREVERCYTHVANELEKAQDDLLVLYRGMLDKRVGVMLKETDAIKALDRGGVRDLDDFVKNIDACLFDNIQAINEMRDRLAMLKEQLRQEELLGQSFRPTFRI
eukprot:TRINITY_DN1543_c0_g2_i3.p1 TRINITY_DN1543_c0_g2~~TRINITY_DN1543_c0_g2_i3.p1  ORF type:complete len:487 (+),score=176.38 TRINITY_DN1543_c0_g2_i3:1-1461(+)